MCAAIFGDGWDCYAAPADATAGYWDGTSVVTAASLVAGRFSGSQAVQLTSGASSVFNKTSGSNDALHHVCLAFQQTAAISGTTLGTYISFLDGATAQCSVVFNSGGSILLTAGGPAGTVLATYSGAVTAANTWYQFEIEVNVSNTAGYMNVRKLGNASNDFSSATNLDTSANANNYANLLRLAMNTTVTAQQVDDFLWRSDASSVPWVGDIRCSTRRPASDAAVTWSRSTTGSGVTQSIPGASTTTTIVTTASRFAPYTLAFTGTITGIAFSTSGAVSGNMKAAIYADNAGTPGAILSSLSPITAVSGTNTFTLGTPLVVTVGQKIWLAAFCDTAAGTWTVASSGNVPYGTNSVTSTGSYATFPQANPVVATGQACAMSSITFGGVMGNYQMVQETLQDAAVTYNYSSTPGQADLYGVSAITSTPAATVMVVTRAYVQKSDAGTRTLSVQLKSGSTTVSSTPATALNTVFNWISRIDTVDPATGAAWTPTGVNNCTIGVIVVA